MAAVARRVPRGSTRQTSSAQAASGLVWRVGAPPTSKTEVESESGVNMWVSFGATAISLG